MTISTAYYSPTSDDAAKQVAANRQQLDKAKYRTATAGHWNTFGLVHQMDETMAYHKLEGYTDAERDALQPERRGSEVVGLEALAAAERAQGTGWVSRRQARSPSIRVPQADRARA